MKKEKNVRVAGQIHTRSSKYRGQDQKEIIKAPREVLDHNISRRECPSSGTYEASYLIVRWRNAVGHRKQKHTKLLLRNKAKPHMA